MNIYLHPSMSQQGRALTVGQKLSVINLKESFDKERKAGPTVLTKDSIGRVAKGLQIGRRSVENILAEYNRNGQELFGYEPKIRGKPPFKVGGDLISQIRHHIRMKNLKGEHISVRNLRAWIIEEHKIEIPIMTLWRTLQRTGFTYGKNKRRSALKEKDYVIAARRQYLRQKILNRNWDGSVKRPEVYLDESYINTNHSDDNTWYFNEDGPWVNKPSGKGPRLIIVNAITFNGWVDKAKLVFQANTNSGDYHGQMNYENFSMWFSEQLLPNIPEESLIIMDNAKYHNILADDTFPTPRSRKEQLRIWLEDNHPELGLHNDPSVLKAEMYDRCKELAPQPEFKLDQIATQFGHRILRTPQYHCELQPIEQCWAIIKNYCRDRCDYTMRGLNKNLEKAFSKVTKRNCQKLIEKVRKQEDLFWEEDAQLDNQETMEQGLIHPEENYINAEEFG